MPSRLSVRLKERKAMRIWYQSMTCLDDSGRYAQTILDTALRLFRGSAEISVEGIERSTYFGHVPGEVFKYPLLKSLVQRRSVDAALAAERQGYDAFIIGSFSEPFLKETRGAVNIPVASLAESALTTAWSLTERFALITLSPAYARRLRDLTHRHGLQSRLGGTYALDSSYMERHATAALGDPTELLDKFEQTAHKAIADGADLIIPAEGILNQIVAESGLNEVEGAVVIDSVAVCLLHTRMLVDMKSKLGISHARKFSYPVPPNDMLEKFT
jgi:Asp/Glu/hydantoin racemase